MYKSPVIEAEFGPNFPRRGNAFGRWLGCTLLRLMGWRIVGSPPNVKKMIVVAMPHTSNWDGFFLLVAMFAAGLDLRWVGKHTLFKPPFGRFLRWAGGVSVNRSQASNFVQAVANRFREEDKLCLVIAPEGTRKPNGRWKTGFHRIAIEADIPIVVGYMDYEKKHMGFGPGLIPKESFDEHLEQLKEHVVGVHPKAPENFVMPE